MLMCTCEPVCIHVNTHIYSLAYIYMHMCVNVCLCTHVYICECVYSMVYVIV